MRWSIPIGRLFGIQVLVHVTFLMFVAWIGLSQGRDPARVVGAVVLILLVFACVLLHELGHALTARRYGIRTRDIVLLPIGGVARLERMPDKPAQEILVAIAGPAVNVLILVVLGGIALALHRPTTLSESGGLLEMLIAVNIVMVLFNLIPAFPMDGGRVLRALLALRLPYVRATHIASAIGQALAFVFGTVGLFGIPGVMPPTPMLMLVALFVFLAASEERAMVQTRTSLTGLPVRAAMLTEFHALDVKEPLRRAVEHLMAGSQQDFPVLDGEVPVGVLTRTELILALQRHGIDSPVGRATLRDAPFAEAGEPLEEAMARMRGSDYSAMPVLQQGRLVGFMTADNVGDLLLVRSALQRFAAGS